MEVLFRRLVAYFCSNSPKCNFVFVAQLKRKFHLSPSKFRVEKFAAKMYFHLIAVSFLSGQLYGGEKKFYVRELNWINFSRKRVSPVIEAAKFGTVCIFNSSLDFEIELDTNLN